MTRSSSSDASIPPVDPGRFNQNFAPQTHAEASALKIEQGINQGSGFQALHDELTQIRQQSMQNGSLNLNQYKAEVSEIEKKLHADGFLPRVHIELDGEGHEHFARTGPAPTDRGAPPQDRPEGPQEAPSGGERHGRGGRHGHGRRGHGRRHHGRHHGRGHHRSSGGEQPDQSDDQAPGNPDGGQLTENDLRVQNQTGGDNLNRGVRRGPQDQTSIDDPNKDRSKKSGDLQIWGAPTISAQQIDKVLRDNHSPAAGLGSHIYDEAVKRGINPAFALAMYGQESTFGTKGAAVRNNSFGNIRGAGGHGYKHYDSVKDGIDEWMRLISSDSYRGKNLSALIHRYAPSSDGNNERGYARYVQNNMAKWARADDSGTAYA